MSDFFVSLRDTIGNFGLQVVVTFQTPAEIYGRYSWQSLPLFGIFFVAKLIDIVFSKARGVILNRDTTIPDRRRGSVMFHFILLFYVFFADRYKKCTKNNQIIHFNILFQQAIVTLVPLYLFLWFCTKVPFYQSILKLVPGILSNIIEGGIVFCFYNWTMNFRDQNLMNPCTPMSIIELQQKAITEGEDKVGYIYQTRPDTLKVKQTNYVNDKVLAEASSIYKQDGSSIIQIK